MSYHPTRSVIITELAPSLVLGDGGGGRRPGVLPPLQLVEPHHGRDGGEALRVVGGGRAAHVGNIGVGGITNPVTTITTLIGVGRITITLLDSVPCHE